MNFELSRNKFQYLDLPDFALQGPNTDMSQNETTRGPKVVLVSASQGKPFWVPLFDPRPHGPGYQRCFQRRRKQNGG